jgi:hypothetical protein
MRKIYIVTSGSYSDYGIHTVFESEEKAEEFIAYAERKNKYCDYRIEDYAIADSVEGYKLENYEVVSAVSGDYFSYTEFTNNTGEEPKEAFHSTQYFNYGSYGSGIGVRISRVKMDGMNEEKARKICADLLAKAKYAVEVDGLKPREAVALLNGEVTQ